MKRMFSSLMGAMALAVGLLFGTVAMADVLPQGWRLALVDAGSYGKARAEYTAQVEHMAAMSSVTGISVDSSLRRDSHGYRQASADEYDALDAAARMC